jgi:hypothetical protein
MSRAPKGGRDDAINPGIARKTRRSIGDRFGEESAESPAKDWRKVIGMFHESEFMRAVDEECHRMREAEREAARNGESPE